MFTYLRCVFASLPFILLACVATSGQIAAQSIFDSCANDLEVYCSQVTPGDGRLSACIYAHEDKVTDECDAATENLSTLMDWFLETVRYAYDQCADDIRNHCGGTEFGDGRILSCLTGKSSELTDGCQEAVLNFSERLE